MGKECFKMFIFLLISRNRLEYFKTVGQKSKTDWNSPPFSCFSRWLTKRFFSIWKYLKIKTQNWLNSLILIWNYPTFTFRNYVCQHMFSILKLKEKHFHLSYLFCLKSQNFFSFSFNIFEIFLNTWNNFVIVQNVTDLKQNLTNFLSNQNYRVHTLDFQGK